MHVTTMRGKKLDMGKLIAENSHKKALGNANMNARGDILGPNGQVIMTRENVAMEYHKNNPKAVKQVPLRNINQEVLDTPAAAVARQKELIAKQQHNNELKTKRKIANND